MPRTIKEIYELLKQKLQNADNDVQAINLSIEKAKSLSITELGQLAANKIMLQAYKDAYNDILNLIETSGVLPNE